MGMLDSGISSLINVGTTLLNRHAQKESNKRNAEQNDINREFSAQQAQLDRDFNAAQSEKQNAFNASEAEKSRIFNADQAAQQMAFQEKMWNVQNEYNTPAAQIARLKAAGINPNWTDGFDNTAGSVSGGAAATSSPVSGSPASHGSVGAPSSIPFSPVGIENPLMMASQIRLNEASAANLEAKTKTEDAVRDGIVKLNDKQYQLWDSQIPVNDANAKYLLGLANKCEAEINSINANISKTFAEIDLIGKQGELLQKDIDSYADRLESDLQEAASRVGLNIMNAKQAASQIALNAAYAQQAYAGASLASAQAQSYALNNYLDGVKLDFYKDNQTFTLNLTQEQVYADYGSASLSRAESKRGVKQVVADEKVIKHQNDDIIAFLRAFGSFINLNVGARF